MGKWSLFGIACGAALLAVLLLLGADSASRASRAVPRVSNRVILGEQGSDGAELAEASAVAGVDPRAAVATGGRPLSNVAERGATPRSEEAADSATGIHVQGRVLDPRGQPVDGATIVVRRGRNSPEPRSTARTGADGRFSVAGASAGTAIGARRLGWAPTYAIVLGPDCAREVSFDLRLEQRPGTLRGEVLDPSGSPIASALVVVEEEGPADEWLLDPALVDLPSTPPGCFVRRSVAPLELRTDERGAFEVLDALPGEVEVRVSAEGRPGAKARTRVEQGAVVALRIELGHGATLFGRATWPDGSPVEKKQIRLRSGNSFRSTKRVDSSDGSFRIEDLPAGEHSVQIAWIRRGSTRTSVTLVDGRETRWNPVLEEHADLDGTVVTQSGEPLAGWVVLARGPTRETRRGKTDASGRFHLGGISSSMDRLDLYSRSSLLGKDVVETVDPWSLPRPLRIVVPPASVPSSRVRFSIEPSQDAAYARFERLDHGGFEQGDQKIEPDGTCVAEDLPPGRYRMNVRVLHAHAFTTVFQLESHQDLDLGVLTLRPRGEVRFLVGPPSAVPPKRDVSSRLFDESGAPVDQVDLYPPDVPWGPLPAGRYRLIGDDARVAPFEVEFLVVAGENCTVDVNLEPATSREFLLFASPSNRVVGTLTRRLLDAKGDEIRSRSVECNGPIGDDGVHWNEGSLVPGRYVMEVRDDVGRTARAAFEIETVDPPAEETEPLRLTLHGP